MNTNLPSKYPLCSEHTALRNRLMTGSNALNIAQFELLDEYIGVFRNAYQEESLSILNDNVFASISSGQAPNAETIGLFRDDFITLFSHYESTVSEKPIDNNEEGKAYSVEMECFQYPSDESIIHYMDGKNSSPRYVAAIIGLQNKPYEIHFIRQNVKAIINEGDVIFLPSYYTFRFSLNSLSKSTIKGITYYSVINYD